MSSLWGLPDKWAPSIDGSDQLALAQQAVTIQQQMAGIQHLGAQTQHLQTLNKVEAIRAQKEGIQLRGQEMMLQRMAQKSAQTVQTGEGLTSQLQEAANDELLMGNPDKAARIMSELAQVENHQASTKLANEKFNEALYEKDLKKKQDMAEIFAGINGPEDFQTAMTIIRGKYPDEKLPVEMETYNPATVDYMKRVTKTGLEQAKVQAQADRASGVDRRHEESLAAARANLEFRESQENARKKMTEERIERTRKVTGPKPVAPGNPDSNMIRAADALVRKDYPNLPGNVPLGKDNVSDAAYDIATEAKVLMASNRGLSASEAMHRVYDSMRKAGAFQTETKKGFFSDTKKDTYRTPRTQDKPQSLPPRGTPLKDGAVYDKGDGTIFRWDGKRGKGVVIPQMSGGGNAGQ